MPSRRTHIKTRHGCQACKARKVRCDMIQPICRSCSRNGKSCSFLDSVDLLADLPLTLPGVQDHGDSRSRTLLHIYAAYTSRTFTDRKPQSALWYDCIPKTAISHRYLLNGILASASLHEQHLARPSRVPCFRDAAIYMQAAIEAFAYDLRAIDQTNCDALFAFAMILSCISFGMLSCQSPTSCSSDTIDGILSIFETLNGIAAVVTQVRPLLHNGELSRMLDPVTCLSNPTSQTLRSQDHTTSNDEQNKLKTSTGSKECLALAESLRATMASPAFKYISKDYSMTWPLGLSKELRTRMRMREPAALILLAQYGLLLHAHKDRTWFIDTIGARLVVAVAETIPEDWREQMLWIETRLAC